MTAAVGRRELDAQLVEALRRTCGLSLQKSLERLLATRLGERGSGELRARIRLGDPAALAELVESAVVGETYFFRHPEQLAALSRHVFHPAPASGPLNIWSAGCASGEEAYSVAAALLHAGRAPGGDRILATDVSRRALDTARAGRYGSWSVRRALSSGEARWLRRRGDGYEIAAEVRASVEFGFHNLLHAAPPGSFDVVLCRNVLIYFEPALARQVLARLVASLRPGGWLALSPAELGLAAGLPLEQHRDGGAILLRRAAGAAAKDVSIRSAPRRSPPTRRPDAAPPAPRPDPPPVRPRAEAQLRANDPEEVEFLRLALSADARGDLAAAIDALRRALYLDPDLAVAHATLVPLYRRNGQPADAERARRNALRALAGIDDGLLLRAAEPITAGALRSALEPPTRRERASRAGEVVPPR